jgi:hypothetical protein
MNMGDVEAERWQAIAAGLNAVSLLFVAFWISQIAAIYCGIVASRKARPLPRSHYFIAVVGINVIILLVDLFASAIDQGLLAVGLNLGPWLATAMLAGGVYFLSFYSARRLRDMGWSPYLTWILLLAWIGYLMMVLLVFFPSKPQKPAMKTGLAMR